ncbi:hypothetical protein DYI26_14695 [Halomonas litopenaei]|nr:hypothetical protein [Halomonas litopenaei]
MMKVVEVIAAVALLFSFFVVSTYDWRFSSIFKKSLSFFFVFIILVFISFKNFGLDLENYREIYQSLIFSNWNEVLSSDWEPLFSLFSKLSKTLGLGFGGFFFLWYLFPFVIVTIISFRHASRPLLAISLFLLLYFFSFMDAARHFAAACYYLMGIHFFASKRKLSGFIFFSLSLFSHFSSLVFVLYYFIKKCLFSRATYVVLIVFCVCSAYILKPFAVYLINNYHLDEMHIIFWKLKYYLTYYNSVGYEFQGWSHRVLWNIVIYSHVVMVISLNFYMIGPYIKKSLSSFERALLGSQVLGSLLFFGFASVGAVTLGVRINYMMSIGVFVLLSTLSDGRFGKSSIGFYWTFFVFMVIFNFFYVLYLSGVHIQESPLYIGF